MSTFALNAYVTKPSFTLNAWVVGGRHRHHRTRDHFGADSDLYTAIDASVGPWGAGTPVKYVLADIYNRLIALSSSHHAIRVCYLNAYVLAPGGIVGAAPGSRRAVFHLDTVVKVHESSSFTMRALIGTGGAVTLNAWVRGSSRFYVNAFVV